VKEIYEIEYKGNFRSKDKMTKRELIQDLDSRRKDFLHWSGGVMVEFEEAIEELEEEIGNEKD